MNIVMTEKIVAYLDVLGFRELVENKDNEDLLNKYFNTIESLLPQKTNAQNGIEIKHLIFSDTIVLATEFENDIDQFCKFLLKVRDIQFELATVGIWLRGGITTGELHIDVAKSRIVGKGLNKAYDLEKLAINPRVIIDPNIIDTFNTTRDDFLKQISVRENAKENDKKLIFIFEGTVGTPTPPPQGDPLFINFLAPMRGHNNLGDKIYDQIKMACNKSQMQYAKYRWLIDYACRAIDGSGMDDLTTKLKKL